MYFTPAILYIRFFTTVVWYLPNSQRGLSEITVKSREGVYEKAGRSRRDL